MKMIYQVLSKSETQRLVKKDVQYEVVLSLLRCVGDNNQEHDTGHFYKGSCTITVDEDTYSELWLGKHVSMNFTTQGSD